MTAKSDFLSSHLRPGEHYAGLLLGKNGEPDRHLVVIAVNDNKANWPKQTKWAQGVGGTLPTNRDHNLLRANLRELFQADWYWSCETHEDAGSCAWYQTFDYGYQDYYRKSAALRAVAVRYIPLE